MKASCKRELMTLDKSSQETRIRLQQQEETLITQKESLIQIKEDVKLGKQSVANELEKITQDLDMQAQVRSSFNVSMRSGNVNPIYTREGARSQLQLARRPRNLSDDLNHSKQSLNSLNSQNKRGKDTPEQSKYITIQFDGKKPSFSKPPKEIPTEQSEFRTLMQQADNYDMDPESRKILKLYLSDDPIVNKALVNPGSVNGDPPRGPTGGSQDPKPILTKPPKEGTSTPSEVKTSEVPQDNTPTKPSLTNGV